MRFFATIRDEGIVVKATESIEDFQEPKEWREVADIHTYANGAGVDALLAGKRMVFREIDKSYPQLRRLFFEE